MERYHGTIDLVTEAGAGTCFTLTFTRPASAISESAMTYQVWIVEDDPMVAAIDRSMWRATAAPGHPDVPGRREALAALEKAGPT